MPEQEMTQNSSAAPKKKGILGCSFPVLIVVLTVFLALFVIGFISGPIGKSLFSGVNLPGWISVPQPRPELPAEEIFHIFGFPVTNTILASWITMLVLFVLFFSVSRRMKIIPGRLQSLLEFAIDALLKFCQSVAGKENGRKFFPIVATIFLFVIINGWLSLLPGFGSIEIHIGEHEVHLLRGANTDINTPLAIALVSFIFVEAFGFRKLKLGYLKKFINIGSFLDGLGKLARGKVGAGLSGMLMGIVNIFVGIIELLSEFVRIISFTLRLFGNMTAGEILLLMVTFLMPYLVALPFYGLEILVGFVQALIFGGLTLIFLTMAVTSHEHQEHGHVEDAHK